jgi:hypothetical protein
MRITNKAGLSLLLIGLQIVRTPAPSEQKPPEIDPNYVMLSFTLSENKQLDDRGGSLLVKTVDARTLNLMVGDRLTLKLIKDSQ